RVEAAVLHSCKVQQERASAVAWRCSGGHYSALGPFCLDSFQRNVKVFL
ncbi:uncharacterized, partial [Tachysurus ichikawai]